MARSRLDKWETVEIGRKRPIEVCAGVKQCRRLGFPDLPAGKEEAEEWGPLEHEKGLSEEVDAEGLSQRSRDSFELPSGQKVN
ncbi:hypothetical protein DPEC_G00331390 [Dallia pectoralis]|uniref:Uncharacterized protein n=1 Tax=Dallia pectoralis TaxID=75939 RepID=A0ACC2F9I2_DALPE|nr:hypothetical protein DPEC_G00331390 [Dallia pectoralis]